jgi:hypothetical protein
VAVHWFSNAHSRTAVYLHSAVFEDEYREEMLPTNISPCAQCPCQEIQELRYGSSGGKTSQSGSELLNLRESKCMLQSTSFDFCTLLDRMEKRKTLPAQSPVEVAVVPTWLSSSLPTLVAEQASTTLPLSPSSSPALARLSGSQKPHMIGVVNKMPIEFGDYSRNRVSGGIVLLLTAVAVTVALIACSRSRGINQAQRSYTLAGHSELETEVELLVQSSTPNY